MLRMVDEDGTPFVAPRDDVKIFISIKNMQHKVLFLKECPRQYFYGFISATNFPWADEVEMTTLRLVEAGIPVWYQRMTDYAAQTHRKPPPHTGYVPVSLDLVTEPFLLYLVGVVLAFTSFVVELYLR
ncbi:uncharacterized protein LOC125490003 [Plutella xylostella]|uniref:uncharacterized protein LOC125490003 n=1 Tax=Plutella xylostella TaxID=51655 RepID=UPI002032EB39|nr:uncharacterized protein LOC125490003 [Plutella xylostella]